ncbi:MAG: HEAT repeat domain-containing protein [Planctomycetota bacterium]
MRQMNFKVITIIGLALLISGQISIANPIDDPFDPGFLLIKDRLVLKSGQTIVGKFIQEEKVDGRPHVVFQTEKGVVLKIDKPRFVARLLQLSLSDIEYNEKVQEISDTAEDHHRMYTWCEDQKGGTIRYKDQIRYHLERIMKLDPNDIKVKRKLNFQLIKDKGVWVPEAKYHELHGYHRKGAGWRTEKQIVIDESLDSQRESLGDSRQEFSRWRNKFKKSRVNVPELIQELYEICTDDNVIIYREAAIEEPDPALRRYYIEAFGRLNSRQAVLALCYFAIEDPNSDLRDVALTLLQQDKFDSEAVAENLTGYLLKNSDHQKLSNAAYAIGELDAKNQIVSLIQVVKTIRKVSPAESPGAIGAGFNNQGISSFGVGGNGPRTVESTNLQVINALEKLTGQSFGVDRDRWYQWYLKNYTLYDVRLRD